MIERSKSELPAAKHIAERDPHRIVSGKGFNGLFLSVISGENVFVLQLIEIDSTPDVCEGRRVMIRGEARF